MTADHRPLASATAVMMDGRPSGLPAGGPARVAILPDGRFTFSGVSPGRYRIRAHGTTRPHEPEVFAEYAVRVDGRDVGPIQMTLAAGATVDGTVMVDPRHRRPAPPLSSLRVRAPFADGSGFGDALTGAVAPNGRFAIRGLADGDHQIVVSGLPDPWVVQRVTWRGHDITDETIQADEGATFPDVRIAITDQAAAVSGMVRAPGDRPAGDAGVLIYPVDAEFWSRTAPTPARRPHEPGGPLRRPRASAGRYLAVAAYELDEGCLGRQRLLEALRPLATALTLRDADARVTLDLPLVRAASAGNGVR